MGSYLDLVVSGSPVAYWRLQETSGLTAVDEMVAHPLTYGVADQLNYAEGGFKLSDHSVNFPGSAGAMAGAANASFLDFAYTDPFSVSFWFTPGTSAYPIFGKTGSGFGGSTGWWVGGINGAGDLGLYLGDWYVGRRVYSSAAITYLTPTTLRHAAVTYDGSATVAGIKTYYDGALVASTYSAANKGTTDTLTNTGVFSITQSVRGLWNGRLSDLAVYNRVLSDSEIRAHASFAPSFSALSMKDQNPLIRSVSRPAKNLITSSSSSSSKGGPGSKLDPGIG